MHSKLSVLDVGSFMSASFIVRASDISTRDMFSKPFPAFQWCNFIEPECGRVSAPFAVNTRSYMIDMHVVIARAPTFFCYGELLKQSNCCDFLASYINCLQSRHGA
jgi:hypothetical protein